MPDTRTPHARRYADIPPDGRIAEVERQPVVEAKAAEKPRQPTHAVVWRQPGREGSRWVGVTFWDQETADQVASLLEGEEGVLQLATIELIDAEALVANAMRLARAKREAKRAEDSVTVAQRMVEQDVAKLRYNG